MVEDIIKAVNHQYVYVSHEVFESMIMNCEQKLLACSERFRGKFKAFFDCPECDEQQLIQLINICEKNNTLFLGFVRPKEQSSIYVYSKKIYPGECLTFQENTLIFQDIPNDCFISCYGNLIVLGKVQGCVEFRYKNSTCTAASFQNARIRIFDSLFQNMTIFSCSSLYYDNNQIKREENSWEVALELHQVKVA